MTNIIRGIERKLDMRLRQDRLEVGMTIREMISKAPGSIRPGWRTMNALARNHKERAEGAHEELMKENTHFLSHQGLTPDFWLHDKLIDGRCEELKYSRWDKSTRMDRGYELLECRFGSERNRGKILNLGEWREVFK